MKDKIKKKLRTLTTHTSAFFQWTVS